MKKLLAAAGLAALLIVWACHLDPSAAQDKFNVKGDSSWLDFGRLLVELKDTNDNVIDTVFNGKLDGLGDLNGLPVGDYEGGVAVFHISGYSGDTLVYQQTRKVDPRAGTTVVEVTYDMGAPVASFKTGIDNLTLYLGAGDSNLKVAILPKFARPELVWSVEGDAVELGPKTGYAEAGLKIRKAGNAMITVHPKGADSLSLKIPVRVVEDIPKLTISPAKAVITAGKEVEFSVKSAQEFGSLVRFEWDLDGDGNWDDSLSGPWAGKEVDLPKKSRLFERNGKYTIRFRVKDSEGNLAPVDAVVEVGERKPSVELLPKDTVISIRDEIRFRAEIQEPGGKLAGYAWDWNADGKADDVATLNDSMTALEVKRPFPDSGVFKILLSAKDSEGKTGADSVVVTVLMDRPKTNPGEPVTAKSRTQVSFKGTATDSFGTIVKYKWDFDGNGVFDDSSDAPPAFTHSYAAEGEYKAAFQVRDDDGNVVTAIRKVTISDLPMVITAIRQDTTVSIKDIVPITASIRNDDGKALSYSWDYNGDGKYDDTVSSSLTTINISVPRPYNQVGKHKAKLRVQDSQGLAIYDSAWITVVLDAPKANLGKDDTVLIGETVAVKLLDTDNKFGSIVKRELQIGDTVWIPLGKQDTTLTMPMTAGTVRLIGRVTDDDGLTGLDTMNIVVKFPTETHLSGIFITPGTLAPAFNADTLAYAAAYAYNVTSVVVGAAARDPKATVTVNGTVLNGNATITLKPGPNPVTIVVSAQDTSAKRTYVVNLNRALSPIATLSKLVPSAGALAPVFAAGTAAYTLALADSVDTLRFTPTVTDTQARVTVAGVAVATGALSQKIPVKAGVQKIDIVVTAASGAKVTYSVTVRKGWSLVGARGFTASSIGIESIAADNGMAYIGFHESVLPTRLSVWKWDKSAWTDIVAASIKDTSTIPPALDVIAGVPWMVSVSYPNNNPGYNINIRKYVGGAWTLASAKQPGGGYGVSELSLDHDKSNLPYFSFHHSYMQQTHYLYKYSDTAWIPQTNNQGFDSVYNLRMAVNPVNGYPTLAYTSQASATSYKAYIIAHNGSSYSFVGGSDWLVAKERVDIAFDSLGSAYYAYVDPTTKKAAVKKYTSAWANLGAATGFSDGDATSLCLGMIGTTPVVAYRDAKHATLIVKIWKGSAWVDFGESDFTIGDIGTVRLAIDNSGVWAAFNEVGTTPKISVMHRALP
jgi:hypothetical protein